MYSKILVAHERMNDATRALDRAADLAAMLHAELFVLGILTPGPVPVLNLSGDSPENLLDSPEFKELQEQAKAWAAKQRVRAQLETRVGNPVHYIEKHAKWFGADLVVLGDIDHTGSWGSLLERSADRVGLRTGCDVLIVR